MFVFVKKHLINIPLVCDTGVGLSNENLQTVLQLISSFSHVFTSEDIQVTTTGLSNMLPAHHQYCEAISKPLLLQIYKVT